MTRRDKHKYRVIKKYLSKRCRGIKIIGSGLLCIGVNGQFMLTEHGKNFVKETEPEAIIIRRLEVPPLKEHYYAERITEPKHEAKEYRNRMNYAKYAKFKK